MVPLLLVGLLSTVLAAPLTVVRTWNGGCQGSFTIHADHEVHGWKAHLTFTQPLDKLDIWRAVVTSHTPTEWTVSNMPWDQDLNSGDDLVVDFNALLPGDNGCAGTVTIEGGSAGTPVNTGGSGSSPIPTTGSSGGATVSVSSGSVTNPGPSSSTITLAPTAGSTGGGTNASTGGVPVSHQCTGCGSDMKYNYREALKLSILFYDAQRSGKLPANNTIPWRGDSNVHDADDGHDLSGGWYDAGDHVKFNLPMAWSATVLLWGMLEFKEGYLAAGQRDMACDMIRTPLDYFLKCWIPDQQRNYVQVGDGHQDHAYLGRPETIYQWRIGWRTDSTCHGSDIAGEMVAAMASGSMVFKDMCRDTSYADKLLEAAKGLYKFGKANRGKYTDCITVSKDFYGSDSEQDDMAVAAAWMYKATKDSAYLTDAKNLYQGDSTPWSFSWDGANGEAGLLLYQITGDNKYKMEVEALVGSFMPGGSVTQTPCGLAWRDKWGPNRDAANVAFIATVAAKYGMHSDEYKKWTLSQINYLLGDNKLHISYEIGYGQYYPKRPHHRGRCLLSSFPRIRVSKRDSKWFTTDNRRLWVFRHLYRLGKCGEIPVIETGVIRSNKMTTNNGGSSISVRGAGGPGGLWYQKPDGAGSNSDGTYSCTWPESSFSGIGAFYFDSDNDSDDFGFNYSDDEYMYGCDSDFDDFW